MDESSAEDTSYGQEEKMQARVELFADLRKMVNAIACSDVVFLCGDRVRVKASRMLLVSRSEMLKCMLMNGMAESKVSEIQLPEISSRVLLSVFEFLYTGDMLDYPLLSWRMGFETFNAAKFFIVPCLEKVVEQFMLSQVSKVAENLPKAALMLNEAMEFKSLCEEKGAILLKLLRVLNPEFQTIYVHGLSDDAMQYLLTNTRGNCGSDGQLSFKEYLRFRQVMMWWICRYCQGNPMELLNSVVPDEKMVLSLLKGPWSLDAYTVQCPVEDGSNQSQLNSALLDKTKRISVVSLMSEIDCRCIPPILLVKVVAPLNIISSEEVQKALLFHALCKPIEYKLPLKVEWKLGSSHSVLEEGSVVFKSEYSIGFAVALLAMSRPYGLYQWCFIIEECTEEFCELGLFSTTIDFQAEELRERLSGQREKLSDQNDARVLSDVSNGAFIIWQGDCKRKKEKPLGTKLHEGSIVMFHYNVSARNCSIFIDGRDYGVAWENLPRAIYYPAVSLGSGSRGRVRIGLVSGFDVL